MIRRRLSTTARLALFLKHDGRCHLCGLRIHPGERWEVEHVIPLAQGGEDGGGNLRPAHVECHKAKTAKDSGDTARAIRRQAMHLGAKAPSRTPLPGGKRSPWKRKMNGTLERRT